MLRIQVSFQPIPKASELQSKVPAGRAALNSKAYQMPVPAFGPGSPGFVSEGMKLAGIGFAGSSDLGSNRNASRNGPELDDVERLAMGGLSIGKPKDGSGDYAGAGAYY